MPDETLPYSSQTDFENDSDFRPSRAVLPQIQVMLLNSAALSLADYVAAFELQAGFIRRPAIVIHITTSKGDNGLHKTPQRRHSAFTECVRNNRLPELSYALKQPALARFKPRQPTVRPISAQTMTVLPGCMPRGYRLRPEFLSEP